MTNPVVNADNKSPFRVAIIGCGPKGMYCLDSLCNQLAQNRSEQPLSLTIYEPTDRCGSGNVYATDQPQFLRMNFPSKKIDAWTQNNQAGCDPTQPSLVQWIENNHPELADPERFVPRSVVGQYLNSCFEFVLNNAKRLGSVDIVHEKVDDLTRADDGWQIESENEKRLFDAVLISIGHGGWRAAKNIGTDVKLPFSNPGKVISSVFPVDKQLGESTVVPGSSVAIGGFALTFIDAALALTEGRGGKFSREEDQWRYQPSGIEPAKIFPFSRTNRFMLAKPNEARLKLPRELDNVWRRARKSVGVIERINEQVNFSDQLWPIVMSAANEAFELVRGPTTGEANGNDGVDAWYQHWINQTPSPVNILSQMNQTHRIANGLADLDQGWALGESWRQLYSVLVEQISHGGLIDDDWPNFRRVASEMEKIAFGPPAENVGRMIALVEAGIVDLSLSQSHASHADNFEPEKIDVDFLLDATIASPHDFPPDSLFGKLIQQGHVSQSQTARGFKTTKAGQAIGADGDPVVGLSVIGRPTEGWVLGNDTLSRNLHQHPQQWAMRVAEEIQIHQNVTD